MEYALNRFGIHPGQQELKKYVGPPLRQMFADYLPPEQVDEGVRTYRSYYNGGKLFFACVLNDHIIGTPGAVTKLKLFAKFVLCHAVFQQEGK